MGAESRSPTTRPPTRILSARAADVEEAARWPHIGCPSDYRKALLSVGTKWSRRRDTETKGAASLATAYFPRGSGLSVVRRASEDTCGESGRVHAGRSEPSRVGMVRPAKRAAKCSSLRFVPEESRIQTTRCSNSTTSGRFTEEATSRLRTANCSASHVTERRRKGNAVPSQTRRRRHERSSQAPPIKDEIVIRGLANRCKACGLMYLKQYVEAKI